MFVNEDVDIVGVQWVVPFVDGVVDAHFDIRLSHRIGQFAQEISSRPRICAGPRPTPRFISFSTRPQAIAVMVFGGQHNIFGSRLFKCFGPLLGFKHLASEHWNKVRIRKCFSEDTIMKLLGRFMSALAFWVYEVAPIPFGVTADFRKRGDRIRPPVNENSEFGITPPLRGFTRINSSPSFGLLLGRILGFNRITLLSRKLNPVDETQ